MNKKLEKKILKIYDHYHRPEYLKKDPLVCVRRDFDAVSSLDLELKALVAALCAYGRVESIITTIEKIYRITGSSISDFVVSTSYGQKKRAFDGITHRFNKGGDFALLFETIGRVIESYGSIHGMMLKHNADEKNAHDNLEMFSELFLRQAEIIETMTSGSHRSFRFFFPKPSQGSACKRLNMLFRWYVRENDGIDLGIWNSISPTNITIPVDVHVCNVAFSLGLTKRAVADWKASVEITNELRLIDAKDPVRFDFSLCRFGMVGTKNNIGLLIP